MITIETPALDYLRRRKIGAITIEASHPVHSCCGEFCFEPVIKTGPPPKEVERFECFQYEEIKVYLHQNLPRREYLIEKQSWVFFTTLHIKNWKLF